MPSRNERLKELSTLQTVVDAVLHMKPLDGFTDGELKKLLKKVSTDPPMELVWKLGLSSARNIVERMAASYALEAKKADKSGHKKDSKSLTRISGEYLRQAEADYSWDDLPEAKQAQHRETFQQAVLAYPYAPEEREDKLYNSEPPPDSRFKFGPLEGTLTELQRWTKMDRRTLQNRNGETGWWIQKVHARMYRIWFSNRTNYANANQEKLTKQG